MSLNFDKIRDTYDALSAIANNARDVYAGENSQALAEERGIPNEKWLDDRVAMQFGQELMAYELAQGIPYTQHEQQARIRNLITRLIKSRLRSQPNDVARRGLLLEAIQRGRDVDDEELVQLSQCDLDALRKQVEELTFDCTMNKVLPAIMEQCALLMAEPERSAIAIKNAGALVVAGYMEVPAAQNVPDILGCEAEVINSCQEEISAADIIQIVAYGLLVIAAVTAYIALLSLGATVFASAAAHLLVEGTVAGIGAAITSEIALVSEFVVAMLKVALGSFVLSGVTDIFAKITNSIAPDPIPVHNRTVIW